MYGIIDVGSNNVRLTIYKIEDGLVKLLLNKKETVGLASYIEQDVMQQAGIDKAVKVLSEFKVALDHLKVKEYHAFATAALRNAKNSAEAIEEIIRGSGVNLEVLSGELQAELDFLGAKHSLEMKDGLLIDIGGASTELVAVRDGKMLKATSFPLGSLNTYEKYVHHLLPTRNERKAIKQAVLAEIDKIPRLFTQYDEIYGIGGTLRATSHLNKGLFQLADDVESIKVPNIKKMIKLLENDETMYSDIPVETLEVLLKLVPDRVQTILPGMIILHTIAKFYKAKNIRISPAGCREGYIYKFIAGENTPMAPAKKRRTRRKSEAKAVPVSTAEQKEKESEKKNEK